jgi:MFS family permease
MPPLLDRWLHRLTPDPVERTNLFWMVVAGLTGTTGVVLISGPVLQTFLVEVGLSESQIGIHGSIAAAASAAGMLGLMGVPDRIKRRVRALVFFGVFVGLEAVVLAALALLDNDARSPTLVFAAIVAVAIVVQPMNSLVNMVTPAVLVRIVRVKIRGRFIGISGLLIGLAALVMGLAIAQILATVGYPLGYALCFTLAVPLIVGGGLACSPLRESIEVAGPSGRSSAFPWSALREVLRMKEFWLLLAPNVLRGLGASTVFFSWIVGLKRLDLPPAHVGLAATVEAAAGTILGSIIIGLYADRWGAGRLLFASGVLMALALIGMVLTSSSWLFLAFFSVLVLGTSIEGKGVPLATYELVPSTQIGAFNGARLMLLSGSMAISMPLVGKLLEETDPLPVMAAGAAIKVVMGALYWFALRRRVAVE